MFGSSFSFVANGKFVFNCPPHEVRCGTYRSNLGLCTSGRLQEQQDVLQTSQDGKRFETALHEFEVWLETAEKSVQSVAEQSNGFDVRNNEELTKQLLEQLWVSA